MAGNAVSGQFGDAKISNTQISEVCKWTFNPKAMNPNYASNKTGGYKARVAGIKDGSGTIEGKYDPTNPLPTQMDVGTLLTLKLYLTALGFYTVPAIIDALRFQVDIDTGDFVSYTADFSTNGAWTNPGAGEAAPGGPEGQPIPLDDAGNPIPQTVPAVPAAEPMAPAAVLQIVRDEMEPVRREMEELRKTILEAVARASEGGRLAA